MKIIPKILIIDDNPNDIKVITSCLTRNGYESEAVPDGESAFEAIAAGNTDLIIISAALPEAAGFNMASRLKSAKETSSIPVIMIIDAGREEDKRRAIKAGSDDLISRPFDNEDMALRVGTAIELSRHRLLLDEKEKFYHVVNSMNNGLVVFDHNMNATFINNKARELLAINLREENTDIVGYICRRFNVIYDGDLARAMRSGPVVFDIERAETGDTRSLILEAYSHVVKSPVKGPGEILMILTDVTEERKEELSKWNFLGLISHKLRTPIAVAHGTVALLRDGMLGPVTEKQEGAYMRISESLHTLIGLVDKLLSFTTIESRTIPAGGELIKVKEYLGELTLPAAVSGSAKKTELMIDCADESVAVRMSRAHLDLIMKNLIENALKFNDKKIARVTVRAGKTAWGVEISVSDNGCGIPQEEKGKIFKKFYQIEKYFTGNVEGAGLGLSIVKRIAGVYGGQVELISEMGEGSTFIVKLPVKG